MKGYTPLPLKRWFLTWFLFLPLCVWPVVIALVFSVAQHAVAQLPGPLISFTLGHGLAGIFGYWCDVGTVKKSKPFRLIAICLALAFVAIEQLLIGCYYAFKLGIITASAAREAAFLFLVLVLMLSAIGGIANWKVYLAGDDRP